MDSLSIWDYIVFGAFLLMSILIGVYYRFSGGRQKTMQEYMLGNKEMHPIPVSMSLMTSFISAVTILGTSSENYLYGTQYLLLNFSYVLGTPIVNYVFLPVFFRFGDKISIYQYLHQRFGTYAKIAASLSFSLQMILYMGVVLYAPSLAISAVTGINKTSAVLIVGVSTALYSTIGGIKAILITDLFQGLLMFFAIFAVISKSVYDVGSVSHILSVVRDAGHLQFFDFDFDPTKRTTVWGTLVGGIFTFLSLHAVNQAQIQRLRTLKTIRSARWSLFASSIFVVLLSFSVGFVGLIMYVHYRNCDPLLSKRICKSDQLVPLYVSELFQDYPGLTGFFIAGLMSGSLSTISTAINSLAAVIWEDFLEPALQHYDVEVKPSAVSFLTKLISAILGAVCIGMTFVAEKFTNILTAAMTIFGIVGGPILGLFTLGMIVPYASEKAAVPSFLTALAFGFWISFGGPRPPVVRIPSGPDQCILWSNSTCPSSSSPPAHLEYFYLYRISYLWYSLIGFSITLVLGCVGSLWFPQENYVDPSLLSPILSRVIKAKKRQNEVNGKILKDPIVV